MIAALLIYCGIGLFVGGWAFGECLESARRGGPDRPGTTVGFAFISFVLWPVLLCMAIPAGIRVIWDALIS